MSVIIACYKAGDYLRQAVESIHAVAPNIPYEIIIIDDRSNHIETDIALNALHITDPKVRIAEQPFNQGQSAARNRAIAMAKYDYLFTMDADDLLNPATPGYLDKAIQSLERNPETVVAYCNGHWFGARKGPYLQPKYSERTMLTDNMIFAYGVFRRSDALEIGGYKEDLRYTEDWEIWLALHNARFLKNEARNAHHIAVPHYLYRQHPHNDNVSKAEKMPLVEHTKALLARSAPLYEHYLGTANPEEVAAIRFKDSSLIKTTFRRVVGSSPSDVYEYGKNWITDRYPQWKNERAAERSQIVHDNLKP